MAEHATLHPTRIHEPALPAEGRMPAAKPAAERIQLAATRMAPRDPDAIEGAMLLDVVLDQMADGVIIADAAGRLLRVNPAAARMHGRAVTGIPPEDWSRSYDLLRVDGEPYPPEELALARAVRHGETVEGEEWMVRRPDGSLVRLLGSAAPLRDARGRPIGAVLVMRDVTERARLVQALRAETAAKERFFAQMSHELRTPVNAVLGYSALLLDGTAGALPPAAAVMVERVARCAQHLRALVDDLLDLGRLDAGRVQLTLEEVPLRALLHDTLASLEPQARARGIALELDAADAPRVLTDAQRVRQIVLNLLSNAVKFTERGGVRVTIERLAPDVVAVRVADTGVGIAGDDLERVFDEFVQVGAAHGGTGLGLAISRRLARLLGGDLAVRSVPGCGSCFTLTLPAAPGCPAGR